MRQISLRLPANILVLLCLASVLVACGKPLPDPLMERSRDTPQWFDDAKLGIFIHWGPASVPAYAPGKALAPGELEEVLLGTAGRQELPYTEWYSYPLARPDSSTARYHAEHYGDAPYRDFGPEFERRVNQSWDPQAWADFFQRVGAHYVVLVTKHHDGYTLWPSRVPNPHAQGWGSERDMVGELAQAVRDRGMRFGVYYSTGLDWTFSLVSEGDLVRDMLRSAPRGDDYAEYAHAHMLELIERYSPDVLWADIGYPQGGRLDDVLTRYFAAVPDGVVNDRWAALDTIGAIAEWPGATPVLKWLARQLISMDDGTLQDDPARIGFKTEEYNSLAGIPPYKWEATRGLGASFAFNAAETAQDMLSADELVRFLVDTVAKNGNLLINVGPDSFGQIPAIQQSPLLGLGEWLRTNGEAVYGRQPWQRFGNLDGRELRYTSGDGVLYATVFGALDERFTLEDPGVPWQTLEVLGANVLQVEKVPDGIEVTLDAALPGPAAVVRYTLP